MKEISDVERSRDWFVEFFDKLYYETYRPFESEERNEKEALFIRDALGLPPGSIILDLGCGYGRHAVYLARWGYHVVCFDLSDYLLEKARERIKDFGVEGLIQLVRGDMRRLDYGPMFDGAYMFFTTFGFFTDEENEEVIRRVSRSLKHGGSLLIDIWNPVRVMRTAYISNGARASWYRAGDYIVLEETRYDVREAKVKVRRVYLRASTWEHVAERSFTIRYYTYWELAGILRRNGLIVKKAFGSYDGEEYSPSSPRMIVVASKESLQRPTMK